MISWIIGNSLKLRFLVVVGAAMLYLLKHTSYLKTLQIYLTPKKPNAYGSAFDRLHS